ncbi:tetratricopeptide repeat protein [Streptomyces sp. UNOC14_S4]|uniref:tetratricopeptide repeat protein n=1 Tax=Streptomyces sp. UNOC14_S4 TaxID=2872340 RepID=UPI0027E24EB2|nr:tetratricopeptide repeat protein [Streptomyces sp. UNOC14_S4]MCC3770784.1 tetratricopeptide repeat protein [Streptomyces sp. UNOC14_S4]
MTTTAAPVARAMALIELGRHEQAAEMLAQHLASHPDDSRALERLSLCRFRARDWTGARQAAEQALAANPDQADAYLRLSETYRALGMPDEAVGAAREAIRLLPQEPVPRVVLSEALRALPGRRGLAAAYEAAVEAVRLGPEVSSAHFAVYFAAYEMGRKDICEQAMRQVLAFDPTHGGARNNLAALAAENPHADLWEALGDISGALAADPNSWSAHHNLQLITRKLMRRACWPALACFVLALATMVATDTSESGRGLPPEIPLPARLFAVAAMAALWTGCLLWARRRIPAPLRRPVMQLPRRSAALRAIILGAAWCTLFSVLNLTVRLDPQWLFGAFNVSALGGLGACMAFAARTKRWKVPR